MIAIFADADAFRIAPIGRAGDDGAVVEVPVAAGAPPDARGEALAAALTAGGFAGAHALLLLASTQCLCATIPTAGLPARNRGQAMLYRFEERLPVAAEDIAADFIVAGDSALAVGVERRILDPLREAMRSAGVRYGGVCPASLLALQEWIEAQDVGGAGDRWFCWAADSGRVELVGLSRRTPVAWYVTSDEPADVAMHVRGASGVATQELSACGLSPEFLERLRSAGLSVETGESTDARRSATDGAKAVLAKRRLPWINLVDDGGGRAHGGSGFAAAGTAGRIALVAVVVFAACLVAALFVRASRYERLAGRYESEQREAFQRLFPDAAVPADVRSRLASEARGAGGDDGASRTEANGLLVLRDVLTFLPSDMRFRVTEIRLDGHAFTLVGDVPTHGDAEALAAALRRRDGFEVQPPRTEQQGGASVGFTINGNAGKASSRRGAEVAAVERGLSR
jgi:hypothetical protein